MPQSVIITPQTNSKIIRTSLAVATAYPSIITIGNGLPETVVYNSSQSNDGQVFSGGASLLHVLPFSTVNNSTGMGMRVVGANQIFDPDAGESVWTLGLIAEFNISFTTNASGAPNWLWNAENQYMMATVTQVAGTPAANIYSPGTAASTNREAAHVLVDMTGFQVVSLQFKAATNAAIMGAFARVI
jgi:hypothetical protein